MSENDFHYRLTTLPNGLQAASLPMPGMRSVSIGFWVHVGGRHESPAQSGISHFLEHMLFKGTTRRNALKITEDIESIGGDINAYTSAEHTCIYATAPGRHLERLIDVMADMYGFSRLEDREVDRERNVIKEEIMMTRDQPDDLVDEELAGILWPGHALGRPLTGNEETLNSIGRQELREHMEAFYAPARTTVTVAGNIDPAQFEEVLENHFQGMARRNGRPFSSTIPGGLVRPLTESQFKVIPRRDLEQMHLQIGYRAFGRQDPRRHALDLLNTIFGGNMSSRLFQHLRERLGLCYSIESTVSLYEDTGSLEITAGLDSSKFGEALHALRVEIDRLRQTAVTERALNHAKDYLLGQMEMALEAPSHHMFQMGEALLGHQRIIDPHEEEEKIRAVTCDEILEVARQIFGSHQFAIAAVVPEERAATADRLISRLLSNRLVA